MSTPSTLPAVGSTVFIRVQGGYHYVGRVVAVDVMRIALVECAWVSDSGRLSPWMLGDLTDATIEVEPYPPEAVVSLPMPLAEVAEWPHDLPREQR